MKKSCFKKSISILISFLLTVNLFAFDFALAATDDYRSVSSDILTDEEIEAVSSLVREHDDGKDYVTFEEYIEENNETDFSEYEEKYEFQTSRLIVRSNKPIDMYGAEACAMFDENTYILQYANPQLAEKAYNKYLDLNCVEFVEADSVLEICKISGNIKNINYNPDNSNFDTYDVNNYMEKPYSATKLTEAKKYMLSNQAACEREVKVAVIDTGVDKSHEAIKGRFIGGYDFVTKENNQGGVDNNGHGTAVAGVIVDRTTPNVKIVSYKVGDDTNELVVSLITLAIKKAIDENIDVINMSFGSLSSSNFLETVIQNAHNKNIIMVASSGNNGVNLDKYTAYPACDKNVIAVGATRGAQYKADYSNYGSDVMIYDFGQPITAYSNNANTTSKNAYIKVTGTSFACPGVVAEASMIRAMYPNETVDEITGRIYQSTENPIFIIRTNDEDEQLDNAYLVNYLNALTIDKPTELYSSIPDIKIERISWDSQKITFINDENTNVFYCVNSNKIKNTEFQKYEDSFVYHYDKKEDVSLNRKITFYAQTDKMLRSEYKIEMFVLGYKENGFYSDDEGTIRFYNKYEYNGDSMNPIIPDNIEGIVPNKINNIGNTYNNAFELESIVCPKSITTLGTSAFAYIANLKSVTALGVTTLGDSAFYGCTELKCVKFANIEHVGKACFENCKDLIELSCEFRVDTIPPECFRNSGIEKFESDFCTCIDRGAFMDCSNLKEVCVPNCKNVGISSFENCENVKIINIPSAERIGDNAFKKTPNLTTINLFSWRGEPGLGDYFVGSGIKNITLYLDYSCTFPDLQLDYLYLPEATSCWDGDIIAKNIKRIEFEKLQEINGFEKGIEKISIPSSTVSINLGIGVPNENLIVYGTEGTEISKFCKENNIEFRNISQETALMTDLPMEYTNADELLIADVIGFNRTYQWYGNNVADNMTGTAIDGATDKEFNPKDYEAYPYYYCVVTSTDVGYDPVEIRTGVTMNKTTSADYSSLNKAVASVPSDLSVYTEESVEALQGVLDGIDYTLPISEQATVDEYVQNVLNAIDNLEYKGADYSSIENAKAQMPVNLSVYTDASVAQLNAVLNSIDYDLKVIEQSIVDEQASAILEAINNLEYKSADYTEYNKSVKKANAIDRSLYKDLSALDEALGVDISNKNITEQNIVDIQTDAILFALSSLEYKQADYSKVEEAKSNIPSDLSVYTEESVDELNDILSSIEYGLDITEQQRVDEFAEMLNTAIKNLQLKSVEQPTEPTIEPPEEPFDEPTTNPSEEPVTKPSVSIEEKPTSSDTTDNSQSNLEESKPSNSESSIPNTDNAVEQIKNPNTGGKSSVLAGTIILTLSSGLIAILCERKKKYKI